MLDFLLTALLTIFLFGILILVHELGHYLAARKFKVGINEFAIGFGPKIFKKQGKYNLFSIRAFPIGGFVSMVGESEEVEDEALKSTAFRSKPIWQRFIVAIAGSFMNVLLGLIVMAVLVSTQSVYASTTIAEFINTDETKSVSDLQGLQVGDQIIEVNGKKINVANDLVYAIMVDGIKPINIVVIREGKKEILTIEFNQITNQGTVFGDLDFKVARIEKTFGTVIHQTIYQSISNVDIVISSLVDTLQGRFGIEGVSGPIGVGNAIGGAAKQPEAVRNVASLFVTIALSLGIFNLLPIPMLDGGMIMFLIYEAIFKRRVPQKVEAALTMFFMMLLILLGILVAFKDVFTIIK
ncbi:MAG: hypothetical protein A2Y17_06605 [Clostridiales bacterium GWF2_38_85]|nr:MAG: hypothetical protein A2Y17_06605 [Clostridiales bacterium GWF2_38_85]HBL84885.1 hypothetical protein [Clostridiales bacterium]